MMSLALVLGPGELRGNGVCAFVASVYAAAGTAGLVAVSAFRHWGRLPHEFRKLSNPIVYFPFPQAWPVSILDQKSRCSAGAE